MCVRACCREIGNILNEQTTVKYTGRSETFGPEAALLTEQPPGRDEAAHLSLKACFYYRLKCVFLNLERENLQRWTGGLGGRLTSALPVLYWRFS